MTGPEMLFRALLPKGVNPAQLMAEAQAKVQEIVTLCQLAENRLAATEAAIARNEAALARIELLLQPVDYLNRIPVLTLIESA